MLGVREEEANNCKGWHRQDSLEVSMLKRFFQEQFRVLKRNRKTTLILAAIFCVLVIAAVVVGVSDNIPGIVLCYLAASIPAIALTYTWRELKKFLILLGASVGGFFVFVVLHNAFYALAIVANHISVVSHLADAFSVASFCIAVFLCPPAFLAGAVGSIVLTINKRRKQAAS